jgi:hypothetical protein
VCNDLVLLIQFGAKHLVVAMRDVDVKLFSEKRPRSDRARPRKGSSLERGGWEGPLEVDRSPTDEASPCATEAPGQYEQLRVFREGSRRLSHRSSFSALVVCLWGWDRSRLGGRNLLLVVRPPSGGGGGGRFVLPSSSRRVGGLLRPQRQREPEAVSTS